MRPPTVDQTSLALSPMSISESGGISTVTATVSNDVGTGTRSRAC